MPRFRRRRFTRRRRPFRRRRILRRRTGRKKRFSRSRRKQRAKSFFYGYSGAKHVDVAQGTLQVRNVEPDTALIITPVESQMGLFPWRDIQEIFEQVRTVDDLIWASSGSTLLTKNRRINLRIKCRGTQDFYVSSGNQAGAIWVEVYICKPRKGTPMSGVGASQNVAAASVILNNTNSAFESDYSDARLLSLSGAAPPVIQDAVTQAPPTITTSDYCVTPYMVPTFTENWKVIRQMKYVLPPGGQFMFRMKTKWLYLDRQQLMPLGGDGTQSAHWGIFRPWYGQEVFFRIHGQPTHAGGTESKSVNFGSATLDIVNVKKYWYSHGTRPLPSYNAGPVNNQGDVSTAKLPAEAAQPVAETG